MCNFIRGRHQKSQIINTSKFALSPRGARRCSSIFYIFYTFLFIYCNSAATLNNANEYNNTQLRARECIYLTMSLRLLYILFFCFCFYSVHCIMYICTFSIFIHIYCCHSSHLPCGAFSTRSRFNQLPFVSDPASRCASSILLSQGFHSCIANQKIFKLLFYYYYFLFSINNLKSIVSIISPPIYIHIIIWQFFICNKGEIEEEKKMLELKSRKCSFECVCVCRYQQCGMVASLARPQQPQVQLESLR